MDIRSNEPYWLVKNKFTKSYPSIDRPLQTEVLVIGGGITGALITYQLLKKGREVVLVDRRDVLPTFRQVNSLLVTCYRLPFTVHCLPFTFTFTVHRSPFTIFSVLRQY